MVRLQVVTGHEFSGVVAETGPGVTDLAEGEPVCDEEIAWCGERLA